MKVQDLILSDYAAANLGGKFTLVGAGIDNITPDKVPYRHPLMFVTVRLKVTEVDIGLNKVEIKLVGEKGVLYKKGIEINVKPEHSGEKHIPAVIGMVNTEFKEVGLYEFQVSINGEQDRSTHKLEIRESQKPASAK